MTYDLYGSLGVLRQKTEPGSIVSTLTYYPAARLATETVGGLGYLTNTYSNTTGKLIDQLGTNRGLTGSPTVDDSFTYGGPGGRVTQKHSIITGGPISPVNVYETWTYHEDTRVRTPVIENPLRDGPIMHDRKDRPQMTSTSGGPKQ